MFISVAEEMGVALQRTSYSPNIKERRDYSCAVFDAQGQMVAQAAHVPVHLGAMPASVRAALDTFPRGLRSGDLVILNDPYLGGTHLPDITLVAPVYVQEDGAQHLAGYVANRGHPPAVGGLTPGPPPLPPTPSHRRRTPRALGPPAGTPSLPYSCARPSSRSPDSWSVRTSRWFGRISRPGAFTPMRPVSTHRAASDRCSCAYRSAVS